MANVAGSKIRLISKALIRYEGALAKIDENENTVTLENVKVFGTEDRNTEHPIPASDSVYAQVVFKGADIKELLILNEKDAMQFNDPAVVSAKEAGGKTVVKTATEGRAVPISKRSMFDSFGGGPDRAVGGGGGGGGGGKKGGGHMPIASRSDDHHHGGKGFKGDRGYDRPANFHYGGGKKGGYNNQNHHHHQPHHNRNFNNNTGYKGGKHHGNFNMRRGGGGYGGKGMRGGMGHRRMDMGHTGKNFEIKNEESAKEFKDKLENDFDFQTVLKNTNDMKENDLKKDSEGPEAKKKPLYNKSNSFYDSAPPLESDHQSKRKAKVP